jgi:hypothetical protein
MKIKLSTSDRVFGICDGCEKKATFVAKVRQGGHWWNGYTVYRGCPDHLDEAVSVTRGHLLNAQRGTEDYF